MRDRVLNRNNGILTETTYARRQVLRFLCFLPLARLATPRPLNRPSHDMKFVMVNGWMLKATDLTDA